MRRDGKLVINMEIMSEKPLETPAAQKLENLAKSAKDVSGNAGFMDPQIKEKKKVGRPSNAEKAKSAKDQKTRALGGNPQNPQSGPQAPPEIQALASIPSKDIARPLVSLISTGAVAWVNHPAAAMKTDELEAGSQALGLLIDKYMPGVISRYGIEAMCLMVFGQYGLRVFALKKYIEIETKKAEKELRENGPKPQNVETETPRNEKIEIFPGGLQEQPVPN